MNGDGAGTHKKKPVPQNAVITTQIQEPQSRTVFIQLKQKPSTTALQSGN